jgi:anionic cell wall polymer biosynthesis LytR-Cps2A-Psr (LCP) family protein
MNRKRWLLLGLDILALLALGAITVYALYIRPLGPSLELRQPAVADVSGQPVALLQAADTPAAAGQSQRPGICDGSGQMNLLLLGESLPASAQRGADAIRLVVVDFVDPAVRVLSMPPVLLVQAPDLEDIPQITLTEAYWHARQPPPEGERPRVYRATRLVAQALLDNFGYDTGNYATLKEEVFMDMVEFLDGVDVYVPEPVDGSPEGYAFYPAGWNDMSGQLALDYVRMMYPLGQEPSEWARFTRQNAVIDGLRDEILEPENWDAIPGLINDFFHFLFTDLNPRELRSLNCMIETVGDQITILEVTPDMVTIDPDGNMIPDVEAISDLIELLESGS